MSQNPPTSANGSVAMMRSASAARRKAKYSSTKMIASVAGTTILSLAVAGERQSADLLDRVAHLARVAHVDGKALQALDRLADVVAADRRGHDAVHVGDVQPVARRGVAVDVDVDVAPARKPLGERGAH